MDSTSIVVIVLIIAVAVIVIVWMLRERIKTLFFKGSILTGDVEMRAEAKADAKPSPAASPSTSEVSDNFAGTNMRIGVDAKNSRVTGNTALNGDMDIQVKPNDPKSRR